MLFTDEVSRTIDEKIGALEMEMTRLKSAKKLLSGHAMLATEPKAQATPKRSRSRSRSSQRSTNGASVDVERVMDAMRAGYHTSTAIAKEVGASDGAVLRTLHRLSDEGHVLRSGERSATRWEEAPAMAH